LRKIEERIQARKSGDYVLADKIRDELLKNGIAIEDKQNKTEWKYK
jgi:cysteinyl-tRNA synthetase